MLRYFQHRLTVVSFYITLDVVVASLAYIASYGEPNFTPGQLMMRMLGAMLMANGLIGGPDTMMFWQESGRRAKAEDERDAAVAELEKTVKEHNQEMAAAVKERDQAVAAAVKERDQAVAAAVKERDQAAATAVKERDQAVAAAVKERDQMTAATVKEAVKEAFRSASAQAAQERAALEQQLAEQGQEIQTLRAQIAGLQEERRPRRRARRRPLRDTDDA